MARRFEGLKFERRGSGLYYARFTSLASATTSRPARHLAATHLGRSADNLPGVMYLLGHKQPATTARYMRPQRDAALEIPLAASVSAALPPAKLSTDSGAIVATDSGPLPATDPIPPDEILSDY